MFDGAPKLFLRFSKFLGAKLPRISKLFLSASTTAWEATSNAKKYFFVSTKKIPVQEIRHHFSIFGQLKDNGSAAQIRSAGKVFD